VNNIQLHLGVHGVARAQNAEIMHATVLQRASHTVATGLSQPVASREAPAVLMRASENVEDQVLSVEGSLLGRFEWRRPERFSGES
jgi:hypothetical protein